MDAVVTLSAPAHGRHRLGKARRTRLADTQRRVALYRPCQALQRGHCIELAKYLDLGPNDAILTVATDGAATYESQLAKVLDASVCGRFDQVSAAETFGEHLAGIRTAAQLELTQTERERIFNLGYHTWVEQQDVSLEDFARRRSPFLLERTDEDGSSMGPACRRLQRCNDGWME